MIVKSAEFICSNTRVDKLPEPSLPEYAFIGRSNVGKSSLINAIVNKKGLAKTSQSPGKTQLINHFLINSDWYLVDLPGYGYAKSSKSNRTEWERFIRKYLRDRENLQCVFVLIDSRHEPQKIDTDFCCWLGENNIPFLLLFTKADKQSRVKSDQNVAKFKKKLSTWFEEVPPTYLTSSETQLGCEEVLLVIEDINKSFEKPNPIEKPTFALKSVDSVDSDSHYDATKSYYSPTDSTPQQGQNINNDQTNSTNDIADHTEES
jgi:GTP-binding protein